MASKTAILAVKITSDAKDFQKGTDTAASSLDKFQKKISGLATPALAVGAGLLAVGAKFGKMASDFEQNSGAVDAVFKNMSTQVDKLAGDSAKKLGLSGSDYKSYAALIGSQLKNAGVPMDQLVGKTDSLINIGADLAAQFGGTVPDAVNAMSSALKGEFEPLDRYGISMSAAKIEAEAAALGFEKVGGAVTDQAKAAAIASIINRQGADAMGANGREATTAAGMQARLTAAFDDMGVKLGTALLPMMVQFADTLTKIIGWVSENTGLVQGLAVGLGILAGAVLVLNAAMFIMNAVAALNPFVFLAIAVAALVGLIIYVATQTTVFQDTWAYMCANAAKNFQTMGAFFKSIIDGIVNAFNWLLGAAGGILSSIGKWFGDVFNGARNTVLGVINAISGAFGNISNAVSGVIGWVSRLFNGFSIPGWLRSVMNFMGGGATGFDMSVGYNLDGLDVGTGATGGFFPGMFGGGGGTSKTEVHNYNITVNGALDPDAVGRQLESILNRRARNTGRTSAAGGF